MTPAAARALAAALCRAADGAELTDPRRSHDRQSESSGRACESIGFGDRRRAPAPCGGAESAALHRSTNVSRLRIRARGSSRSSATTCRSANTSLWRSWPRCRSCSARRRWWSGGRRDVAGGGAAQCASRGACAGWGAELTQQLVGESSADAAVRALVTGRRGLIKAGSRATGPSPGPQWMRQRRSSLWPRCLPAQRKSRRLGPSSPPGSPGWTWPSITPTAYVSLSTTPARHRRPHRSCAPRSASPQRLPRVSTGRWTSGPPSSPRPTSRTRLPTAPRSCARWRGWPGPASAGCAGPGRAGAATCGARRGQARLRAIYGHSDLGRVPCWQANRY